MGLDTKALRKNLRRSGGLDTSTAREALDEIDSLRRERDALATARDAAQAEVEKGNAGARLLTAQWEAALANARAAALEEAAGVLLRYGYAPGCLEIRDIRALAQTPPSGRYVESVVLHSILGHIEASMQHTHGVDCRGFDDGDDLNSDGDCGCGLVSASKARAALAALEDGREKHGT